MVEMENEGEGAGAALTFTLEEFNSANIFIRVFCVCLIRGVQLFCVL